MDMNANELIEEFAEAFGDRLRSERKRLGLSQAELAELAGVRKQAQMHYEAGYRSPQAEYLYRVSQAGVNVAYVLTGQIDVETVAEREAALLESFRSATADIQKAALSVLGISATAAKRQGEREGHTVVLGNSNRGHIAIGSTIQSGNAINIGSRGKRSKVSK